jgi:pimeloyl-ACP methyl ester carboxylesterase
MTATFVLVHGAWHGGWCWRDVKAGLEQAGHRVLAPTLSGLGDRAGELSAAVSLSTHIEDVSSTVEAAQLDRFVLVGHSYGGMVITGVADRLAQRIDHLVYLDAAIPRDGQSMLTVGELKSPEVIEATRQGLAALSADGGLSMQALPVEAFGIPPDHPSHDWVQANLTPHPFKTWLDPIMLVNGGGQGVPKTYIHCSNPVLQQSSFPYYARQVQSKPDWRYVELSTGHDAMITVPEELCAIMIEELPNPF